MTGGESSSDAIANQNSDLHRRVLGAAYKLDRTLYTLLRMCDIDILQGAVVIRPSSEFARRMLRGRRRVALHQVIRQEVGWESGVVVA